MINQFMFSPDNLDIFMRLFVAMICGMLLGTERVISHKSAGMRTYALVSMGAALFVTLSDLMVKKYLSVGVSVNDPLQIPSMIISGIGFMGAGMIIFKDAKINGLTTASGLWVAAGIGMACGFTLFAPAIIATLLSLFVFIVLYQVERGIKNIAQKIDPDETQ